MGTAEVTALVGGMAAITARVWILFGPKTAHTAALHDLEHLAQQAEQQRR